MLEGAHIPNVYLNGVLIKQFNSVKYLGHFLTCELSDDIELVDNVVFLTFVAIIYFVNFTCVVGQ